jgi:protein-tyrosine-phosphatase
MYPQLALYVAERVAEFPEIPAPRREALERLASCIRERRLAGDAVRLMFICTHNSRRSQLCQVWAAAAARYYDLGKLEAFSGGTEATAFNPRAVAALERAGWQIQKNDANANPIYELLCTDGADPIRCFSKRFSQLPNPQQDFTAIMTCAQVDQACPDVPGAGLRIAIPYDDPKASDDTTDETAVYDERCRQIAREMLYLMALVEGPN